MLGYHADSELPLLHCSQHDQVHHHAEDDGGDGEGDEHDDDVNDEDGEDLRDFERGSVKYKTNITTIYVTHQCTRGDRVEDKHSIRIKSCIACKPQLSWFVQCSFSPAPPAK